MFSGTSCDSCAIVANWQEGTTLSYVNKPDDAGQYVTWLDRWIIK